MSTAQSLIDDVRARIVEANADFFEADTPLLRWLNQGYRNFCLRTGCLEKVKGFAMTANQFEYTLPTDLLDIIMLRWNDQYFVRQRDMEEFSRIAAFSDSTSDRPTIYRIFPNQSKFRVYPIPNTTSATTTLNGAVVSTSAASITLTSTSSFPTRGRVLIDSEQILYYNKSSTQLLQCVRGDGGTTAATHLDAATVTHLPLTMHYSYIPPAMVVSSVDCELPVEYDEAIIAYATAIAFRAKDKYEVASQYQKTYKEILDTAIEATAQQQRDRLPCIKDDDWGD